MPLFQAFGDEHDAAAVPEDQLDAIGPLRPEHVYDTREWVGAYAFAHHRREPLCSFAEVDRLRRHQNPNIAGGSDHAVAFSARITASMVRGFASAPTRTSTPAISSSMPSDRDRRRRGRRGD